MTLENRLKQSGPYLLLFAALAIPSVPGVSPLYTFNTDAPGTHLLRDRRSQASQLGMQLLSNPPQDESIRPDVVQAYAHLYQSFPPWNEQLSTTHFSQLNRTQRAAADKAIYYYEEPIWRTYADVNTVGVNDFFSLSYITLEKINQAELMQILQVRDNAIRQMLRLHHSELDHYPARQARAAMNFTQVISQSDALNAQYNSFFARNRSGAYSPPYDAVQLQPEIVNAQVLLDSGRKTSVLLEGTLAGHGKNYGWHLFHPADDQSNIETYRQVLRVYNNIIASHPDRAANFDGFIYGNELNAIPNMEGEHLNLMWEAYYKLATKLKKNNIALKPPAVALTSLENIKAFLEAQHHAYQLYGKGMDLNDDIRVNIYADTAAEDNSYFTQFLRRHQSVKDIAEQVNNSDPSGRRINIRELQEFGIPPLPTQERDEVSLDLLKITGYVNSLLASGELRSASIFTAPLGKNPVARGGRQTYPGDSWYLSQGEPIPQALQIALNRLPPTSSGFQRGPR